MGASGTGTRNTRLLAVTYAMPPVLMPRTIQVPRTLKALAALGWQPTALCADVPAMDRRAPRDETLARLSVGDYRTVYVRPPLHLRPLLFPISYRLLTKFDMLNDFWRRWAIREGSRVLRQEQYSAMITFAQPWQSHLVGLELHRRTSIPWLAHFSDPWVDSPYLRANHPQMPTWRKQEEAVIRNATAVIFVTAETAETVMNKYPANLHGKAYVVPHGYDKKVLQALEPPTPHPRLRLVYTGNFYGIRTPVPLLRALEQLNRSRPLAEEIEVLLVGDMDQPYGEMANRMGLSGLISFQPPVSFLEALQLAANADVLLLIDAPSDGASMFLPSKLVDYIMLRKPILGITPCDGASAKVLQRLECPVAPPQSVEAIVGAVESLLQRRRDGTMAVSSAYEEVAGEFDMDRTTQVLDRALQEASGNNREASRRE